MNFSLSAQEAITPCQLKEILDDYIQFPALHISIGYIVNILYQLKSINVIILTDPLIIYHEFYSLLIYQSLENTYMIKIT
jgi:hypothetical protein